MTTTAETARPTTGTASRGRLRVPVGILGCGVAVPDTVVTNADLERHLDTSDAWIRSHIGIRERRWVTAGQNTSDLCVAAAADAIAAAGIAPADIDAIVVTTITPDQPLPSTALTVKERIGATRAVPLDLNQVACAGGVYGVVLGAQLMQNGDFAHVLVIGADALSRVTDPGDRRTRVYFGDAAGAVVLGPVESGFGLLSWDLGSALSHSVEIVAGGAARPTTPETAARGEQYLRMEGREVWRVATGVLPRSIRAAAALAGVDPTDIAHLYLHQANLNIINDVLGRLGVSPSAAPVTVRELGNTGAASIFTALHAGTHGARPRRGELVLLSAIGAGFCWGSVCLRQQ
ncbi:3-oxoacyl-ACP synthase III family protein [Actinokineospora enzanensis]|uniref:3-oxoacyl-ACP synthase III family protein n=1 Tax=Actinokineospora enzanensis TaxID=155975 RepID=UPI00037B67D2|nr:beta-ketoacyl-ACP synthase 3 [Actinokineospora enzanensis]